MKNKNADVSFLQSTDFLALLGTRKSILGEKLVTILKAKLAEEKEGSYRTEKFRQYAKMENGSIAGIEVEEYSYINYNHGENVHPEGDGWSWFYVTGPNSIEELQYSGEFEGDVNFFKCAYDYWIGIHNEENPVNYAEVAKLADEAFSNRMGNTGLILSLMDVATEYVDGMYCFCSEFDDSDEEELVKEQEVKLMDCMRAFFYAAWYIDHFIYGTAFSEEQEKEFDKYFEKVYRGKNEAGALWYMDDFLCEFTGCIEMDKSAYPIVLPLVMSGFFSIETDEEGTTPTVDVFKSCHMKEYRDLKALYPDSSYVTEIDKLLCFAKKEIFDDCNQSDMIRKLLAAGLEVKIAEFSKGVKKED